MSGDGFVVSQIACRPGAPIEGDGVCRLVLERSPRRGAARGAAMTWAELHGVLRGRGLIRADDALRAEAAVGVVTGIAYDSRAVDAGPGVRRAQGAARRRRVVRAGRRSSAAPRRSSPSSRRPPDVHVPWAIVEDARLALARARGRVLSPSERRDAGRRHHRHQRQDDDGLSDRVDLRSRRHPLRRARHGRLPDRRTRAARSGAHDAGSAGRAGAAARDGRSRLRRLRDGSVVARAVAAARRRHAASPPACSPT